MTTPKSALLNMTVTPNAFRKAVYCALLLSVLCLGLVCLPIIGPSYTLRFAMSYSPQVAVGYGVIIILIELLGVRMRNTLTLYWAGALFAFFLFIMGSVAASACSMLVYQNFDPHSYVVKPLFWLSFYGFIPATMVGMFGSYCLRVISKKSDNKTITK